ncbi:helix-turn-helix domain-containing protein [Catellatospora aurea]|uniref:Helix-turn-helix domain-containing protein n=1 Tax=Catellatospora aurea TaxID=1337874 RepID=A0ABW2GNF7_9ACTN
MGQSPRDLDPTVSLLHFFGAEVRRRRCLLGLSQAALGRMLFQHRDLVRKIEAAERMPTKEFVERCDEVLDAHGALLGMWPMLERERSLRSANDAMVYRSEAADRSVLDWLLFEPRHLRPAATTSGSALPGVHALAQLRQRDHAEGGGATYSDVINLLDTDDTDLVGGALELAGYQAVDLGADGVAQLHYLRALDLAVASGQRLYGGYLIAVSLGHLALHCGDAQQAARLATAALRGSASLASPGVSAAFRLVLARAHARRGDKAACCTALLQADADLARRDPADEPAWISYFGEAEVADEKAHCFFDLGWYEPAQREATRAVALLNPCRVRRLGIDTALLASALARAGDLEQACVQARHAVDLAVRTASFRAAHRVAMMLAELHRHRDLPAVHEVAEYAFARSADLSPAAYATVHRPSSTAR